jgi:cytidine deaminase
MDSKQLLMEAKKAREKAYAPYSHHKVGAALLTKSGKVYHGCNIENAGFSPTVCAERTAFFKAVYDGEREFSKIAVVGAIDDDKVDNLCAPCGVCRQVMMEFCDPESFVIVMANGEDKIVEILLKDLLPYGFGPNNL